MKLDSWAADRLLSGLVVAEARKKKEEEFLIHSVLLG